MDSTAPIALFVYNRPDHAAATLEALSRNELAADSDLTIFCDGPRTPEQEENTRRVREIVRATTGFRSINIVERTENWGLARSVIAGVSQILENSETIIVMEDDLITSPYFLRYMNDGLRCYADEEKVLSICGYRFPVAGPVPETFLLPGAFCWGWATWRRGWALFEHDAARVLSELFRRDLVYEFDFRGTDQLTKILQLAVNKDSRVDSWALRWMGAACLNRMFTLYPGLSLVANEGFDSTGVHAKSDRRFESPMADRPIVVERRPAELDEAMIEQHRKLFASWRVENNLFARIYYAVTSILPRKLERRLYTRLVRLQLSRLARK